MIRQILKIFHANFEIFDFTKKKSTMKKLHAKWGPPRRKDMLLSFSINNYNTTTVDGGAWFGFLLENQTMSTLAGDTLIIT